MIRNFRHNGLRRFWERDERQRVPSEYADKILRILLALDGGSEFQRMEWIGYRLHRLTGDMSGFWAVRVSANWRIIFRYEGTDAYDVDLIDYH